MELRACRLLDEGGWRVASCPRMSEGREVDDTILPCTGYGDGRCRSRMLGRIRGLGMRCSRWGAEIGSTKRWKIRADPIRSD